MTINYQHKSVNYTACITPTAIIIRPEEFVDMKQIAESICADRPDIIDAVKAVMPQHWDTIVFEEHEHMPLTPGSAQIFDCSWDYNFFTNHRVTELTITNFR